MKRTLLLTGVVALVLLGAGVLSWRLSRGRLPDGLSVVNGRIEGDPVVVAAKVAGRLVTLRVKEGDAVEVGQPIAEISSEQILARVEQAAASRESARNALAAVKAEGEAARHQLGRAEAARAAALARQDKAAKDAQRAEQLFKRGVIAQAQLDEARAARDVAAADVRAAAEQVSAAQRAIEAADAQVAAAERQLQVAHAALDESRRNLRGHPGPGSDARRRDDQGCRARRSAANGRADRRDHRSRPVAHEGLCTGAGDRPHQDRRRGPRLRRRVSGTPVSRHRPRDRVALGVHSQGSADTRGTREAGHCGEALSRGQPRPHPRARHAC